MMTNDNFNGNEHQEGENMDWGTEANTEFHSSEWIGAIIRYFFYFGRRKFKIIYQPKELKKNVALGWSLKVALLLILIYIGYRI
ncbi:hypothetical protein [Spongiimicrobium salis]|uniref:hypothetical protein n=1 Tax=Spongiimicrobium salis TaxID=1667022 RepID=UPI00374CFD5E